MMREIAVTILADLGVIGLLLLLTRGALREYQQRQ